MLRYFDVLGGCFQKPLTWDLFGVKDFNHRVALVYGKNGYGKSSFANCISLGYEKDIKDASEYFTFAKDEGLNKIPVERFSFRVFCDAFVDSKIGFNNDGEKGLGTIVMLGAQKENGDRLKVLEKELAELLKEKNDITENLGKYDSDGDGRCIRSAESKIVKDLKPWADREMLLRGLKRAATINDSIIQEIRDRKLDSRTEKQIREAFEEKKKTYEDLKSVEQLLPKAPDVVISKDQLKTLFLKLETQLNQPIGNDYQKRLEDVLRGNSADVGRDNIVRFSKANDSFCPLCLRPINQDEKKTVINALNQLFNDDANELLTEIDAALPSRLNIDWLNDYQLPPLLDHICEVSASYNDLHKYFDQLDSSVKRKKDNPWQPVEVSGKSDILEAVDKFNEAICAFCKKIDSLNADFNKKAQILLEAQELNKALARKEADSSIKTLQDLKNAKAADEVKQENNRKSIAKKENEIAELKEKSKDTGIILKLINESLRHIYLSDHRLELRAKDDGFGYQVLSHGKKVPLNKLSSGEKHVISLVYFFAMFCEGKREGDVFNDPAVYVIDDPISSLDGDVKLGLLGYLKGKMRLILSRNPESQICILSHDFFVVYSLTKICDDLDASYAFKRIDSNCALVELPQRTFNDYKYHLSECYKSALDDAQDVVVRPYPMNEMRRVLEAYSNFNYSTDCNDLASSEVFINKITDKDTRDFFLGESIFRLVLNSLSHTEFAVKATVSPEDLDCFDPETQLKALRLSLLFLWSLDQDHFEIMLESTGVSRGAIRKKMQEWKQTYIVSA